MEKINEIIAFHADADGVCAAYLSMGMNKNMRGNPVFIPVNYNEDIKILENIRRLKGLYPEIKKITFLDWCPHPSLYKEIGLEVLIIDHHKQTGKAFVDSFSEAHHCVSDSDDNSLTYIGESIFYEGVFDMSTTSYMLKICEPFEGTPAKFLKAVGDRDIGLLWSTISSEEEKRDMLRANLAFYDAISNSNIDLKDYTKSYSEYEILQVVRDAFDRFSSPEVEAKVLEYSAKLQEILKGTEATYAAWLVECNDKSLVSDLGFELAKNLRNESNIGITYSKNPDKLGYSLSIRSVQGGRVEALNFLNRAMAFNPYAISGGGHLHACGATISVNNVEELFEFFKRLSEMETLVKGFL